jgi:hypothetical protein
MTDQQQSWPDEVRAELEAISTADWLCAVTRLERLRMLRFVLTDLVNEADALREQLREVVAQDYKALTRDYSGYRPPYIQYWREFEAVAHRGHLPEDEKAKWAAALRRSMARLTPIAFDPSPEAKALYDDALIPHFREEEMVTWVPSDYEFLDPDRPEIRYESDLTPEERKPPPR